MALFMMMQDPYHMFLLISVPCCPTKFQIVATSLIYSGLVDVVTSMHKTQHNMIIFLMFAMLFLGLTYFPIKQTFAQPQASAPTTSAQVQPSQSQQPSNPNVRDHRTSSSPQ